MAGVKITVQKHQFSIESVMIECIDKGAATEVAMELMRNLQTRQEGNDRIFKPSQTTF